MSNNGVDIIYKIGRINGEEVVAFNLKDLVLNEEEFLKISDFKASELITYLKRAILK